MSVATGLREMLSALRPLLSAFRPPPTALTRHSPAAGARRSRSPSRCRRAWRASRRCRPRGNRRSRRGRGCRYSPGRCARRASRVRLVRRPGRGLPATPCRRRGHATPVDVDRKLGDPSVAVTRAIAVGGDPADDKLSIAIRHGGDEARVVLVVRGEPPLAVLDAALLRLEGRHPPANPLVVDRGDRRRVLVPRRTNAHLGHPPPPADLTAAPIAPPGGRRTIARVAINSNPFTRGPILVQRQGIRPSSSRFLLSWQVIWVSFKFDCYSTE